MLAHPGPGLRGATRGDGRPAGSAAAMLIMRLLRAYLFRRLLAGGRRRPRGSRFVGPFPTYSTRSRRGSRVTVSGCCLPIPLALTVAAALGARSAVRR
jgi:hypothetical protein